MNGDEIVKKFYQTELISDLNQFDKIVSMVTFEGGIYIATEHRVFRMTRDYQFEALYFKVENEKATE